MEWLLSCPTSGVIFLAFFLELAFPAVPPLQGVPRPLFRFSPKKMALIHLSPFLEKEVDQNWERGLLSGGKKWTSLAFFEVADHKAEKCDHGNPRSTHVQGQALNRLISGRYNLLLYV